MRPRTPYETLTTLLGGGLNVVDAPDLLPEGKVRELNNFGFAGQGRVTPRKAATSVATIPGQVVGIAMFPHGSYNTADGVQRYAGVAYLTWVDNRVDLYLGDGVGQNLRRMGMLAGWSPVNTKPRLSMATINRKLFVTDESKIHGLTVFDPFHPLATTDTQSLFYQPSFIFDPLCAPQKMMPRALVEYNNFLIATGYGTGCEPSRPEIVRFSYLGLFNDGEGIGDAGYAANPDAPTQREFHENLNVFDIEDFFMVGERGTPVVAMAPALGRLVIGTPYNAWVLFGYDRDSFQLELLDNTRGCTGTNAMVAAHGMVYWWSNTGPVRWNGSGVQDLSGDIRSDIDSLNPEKVVAVHVRSEREVRFYQGRRGFAFNYEKQEWARITLPEGFDVWCAGGVSPYTSTNTGASAPRVGPGGKTPGSGTDETNGVGAPRNLQTTDITQTEAISSWENADSSPDVKTLVWRKRASDVAYPLTPAATLEAGENRFAHTGLTAGTSYEVRVAHEKNNIRSGYATAAFGTNAPASAPNPPKEFRVVDDPVPKTEDSGTRWLASALLRWKVGTPGARTEIYRYFGHNPGNDPALYDKIHTTDANESAYRDLQAETGSELAAGGYVTYLIRHLFDQGPPSTVVTVQQFLTPERLDEEETKGEDDGWGAPGRESRRIAGE